MNEQAQKIAIAEACGYHDIDQWGVYGCLEKTGKKQRWIPDYVNDLNAINEAISIIPFGEQLCYTAFLELVVRGMRGDGTLEIPIRPEGRYYEFQVVNATARQRAEALLRTLGKWNDDE